ncbi:hypothetical protein SAY87_013488 [Trapa incisa]|uniref:Uncharacterized protein n=1 Tax=Trapa incisa TaxID=236973 RepID=A0AAN7KJK2_9MYRT|nr:hypothetical protein SAY87_013488 [Trapa incisa]
MELTLPKKRGRPRKRPLPEVENDGDEKLVLDFKKQERSRRPVALVGRYVLKEFSGNGTFLGKIVYYDTGMYRVEYEDGDYEDLESRELRNIMIDEIDFTDEQSRRRKKLDKRISSKRVKTVDVSHKNEVDKLGTSSRIELGDVFTAEDDRNVGDGDDDCNLSSNSDECEQVGTLSLDAESISIPPALQLPQSSGSIGIPEDYISHLLSVYGILRSFSITLFLYPFGLDDFVGAVNCNAPNTLLDAIHVALMLVLKRHLESLFTEGSELASKCLRCIDWSLLDNFTWPVYVLHYLTNMGYAKGPEWRWLFDGVLEKDYYSLSAGRKLLVLQILSDEVLDSKELRAEIDTREESEVGIDPDGVDSNLADDWPRRFHTHYSRTSTCYSRQVMELSTNHHDMKPPSNSASKSITFDETAVNDDGNGDECRLCGMDGTLLCCDGCPSAYHSRCIGLVKTYIPEGTWHCPECTVSKLGPTITPGTSLVGGEIFGVDPYGQLFLGTCNHLLVLKTSSNEKDCYRYYNQRDIVTVLQALNSSMQITALYLEICKAIIQYWDIPDSVFPFQQIKEACENEANEREAKQQHAKPLVSSTEEIQKNFDVVDTQNVSNSEVNSADAATTPSGQNMTKQSQRIEISVLGQPCVNELQKECSFANVDLAKWVTGAADLSSISNNQHCNSSTFNHSISNPSNSMLTVKLSSSAVYQHMGLGVCDRKLVGDCLYFGFLFKPQAYMNHYMHANFAASAAANLATLSAEEGQVADVAPRNPKKASSIISQQMKAFSSSSSRFFWPNSEKKFWEVPRERCGWCYCCQGPLSSRRGCLLNSAATMATKNAVKILSGLSPIRSGEGNLPGMATYILLIEESFHGLIGGPFLSENFRREWRKMLMEASSCIMLKTLLLKLEKDIYPVAFSGDWFKLVDDCLAEYSVTQGAACTNGTIQKRGPGRRSKKQSLVSEATEDECLEKSFCWWRGGKLSKILLAKAVLPCSMIKGAARQAGLRKIVGAYYADSFEAPRRSRQSQWRAAVEMSKNASQLALQVRYLDFHLRWNDLIRPELNLPDGKGPELEGSAFRNATVCDKKIYKNKIAYGVDFGMQKHLPSRVMKTIIDVEPGGGGNEKHWFYEAHIPLYLIKDYEERLSLSSSAEVPLNFLVKMRRMRFKAARMDIFSYLVYRRENVEKITCSSCRQDVLIRNVVRCSACQGYCHDGCVIFSKSSIGGQIDSSITCKRCHHAKSFVKKDTTESPTSPLLLQVRDQLKIKMVSEVPKIKISIPPSAPVKSKEEPRNSSSAAKTRNTSWGVIWNKKSVDDIGPDFRKKHILLRGNADMDSPGPVCKLCEKPYNPNLMYIRCPSCSKWYHADALEVNESRISEVIGFKCCKCRRIKSPDCPYANKIKNRVSKNHPSNLKQETGVLLDCDSGDMPESRGWEPTTPLISSEELSTQEVDPFLQFAASQVENIKDENLELDVNWVTASGPQKLPVRRHLKREPMGSSGISGGGFPQLNPPTTLEMDVPMTMDSGKSPSLAAWDISVNEDSLVFDDEGLNYEDMEFEPQTYFSFTELLGPDGDEQLDSDNMPGKWENWDAAVAQDGMCVSGDEVEYSISLDTFNDVSCQVCSCTDPAPSLNCEVCGLCIHSECSPWDESNFGGTSWRCGNCREWC